MLHLKSVAEQFGKVVIFYNACQSSLCCSGKSIRDNFTFGLFLHHHRVLDTSHHKTINPLYNTTLSTTSISDCIFAIFLCFLFCIPHFLQILYSKLLQKKKAERRFCFFRNLSDMRRTLFAGYSYHIKPKIE